VNNIEFKFEKLEVWQKSVKLTEGIYKIIRLFPEHEKYVLADQLRRAAISVTLNIAEGQGRHHNKDFTRFLYNSRGSLYETITCLKLAMNFGYIQINDVGDIFNQCDNILRQLNALISYLNTDD
jgi:four helix bundle protein